VNEYVLVVLENSVIVPDKVPDVDKVVPGGVDDAVYTILESPVAARFLERGRVLVAGARLVVDQMGYSLHVTADARTADVPSLFTTKTEYVPGVTPTNRARNWDWEIAFVTDAATLPRRTTAPAPKPVPWIVKYESRPSAVSSKRVPDESVMAMLEIVTADEMPVRPEPLPVT
jgi:hypothetical protein